MKTRVYTSPSCPYCKELTTLLDNDSIDYTNVDVSLPENHEEFNEVFKHSNCSDIPIVAIGNQLLIPDVSFRSIQECYSLTKRILG